MSTDPAPSYVAEEFPFLLECFASVTDPRHARGKIHPLPNVLALTVLGLMAGQPSLIGIARWSARQPRAWQALGLRRSPSVATLWRLTQQVQVREVRAALAQFTRAVHQARQPPDGAGPDPVVALDGKTLRGTREGNAQLHVLHAFATASCLVLDQVAVTSHGQEPTVAQAWLAQLQTQFPAFSILTGDALYAEQTLCAAIVGAGKHYVVKVKKTNPRCWPTCSNSLGTPTTRQ